MIRATPLFRILFSLLLWLAVPVYGSTVINGGNITNQTWTLTGSPYLVMGDITIVAGGTLTIEGGVIVKFALSDQTGSGADVSRCELIVKGRLTVVGLSASEVVFTSASSTPSNNDWYGVVIVDGGVAEMDFCKIEYCIHNILPGSAGTITGASVVCAGASGVSYSVPSIEGATSYRWTLPTGATTTSSASDILVDFDYTAVSGNIQVVGRNAFGDGAESLFAVTVNSPPAQPVSVSGSSTICSGSSNTYSTAKVTGATSYTWTLPDGWSGESTTTSINTTATATGGDISVTANNPCPSQPRVLPITVESTPEQPGPISGSLTICSGSSNVYSIAPVDGATGYSWTLPGGWTGSSTENSITTMASETSGNIVVTANNVDCSSLAETLAITVNSAPAQPMAISGDATVCAGSTSTYSIEHVSGATSYSWTLPDGWAGSSTTSSIDITAGSTSSEISVIANNFCSSSIPKTLAVEVFSIPVQPGTISGDAAVCEGSVASYSIDVVSGAATYIWTLPDGWSGSSTTNSIQVTGGTLSGDISVVASNSVCGSSPATSIGVSVIGIPPQPTITLANSDAPEPQLASSSETGNQWFRNDVAIIGATGKILVATETGTYSVEVNNEGCISARSEGFSVNITGLEVPGISGIIQLFPNPATEIIILDLPDHWQSCDAYVYDDHGRLVEELPGLSGDKVLNVGHFVRGLYYVTVRWNREYYQMRFVK